MTDLTKLREAILDANELFPVGGRFGGALCALIDHAREALAQHDAAQVGTETLTDAMNQAEVERAHDYFDHKSPRRHKGAFS